MPWRYQTLTAAGPFDQPTAQPDECIQASAVQACTGRQSTVTPSSSCPPYDASHSPWEAHCRAPGPPLHIAPGSSSQCSRCPPAGHNEMAHQQLSCSLRRARMSWASSIRVGFDPPRTEFSRSPPQSSPPVARPRGPTPAPCPRLDARGRCRAARVAGQRESVGRPLGSQGVACAHSSRASASCWHSHAKIKHPSSQAACLAVGWRLGLAGGPLLQGEAQRTDKA